MSLPKDEALPAAVFAAGLEGDWNEVRTTMSEMSSSDQGLMEYTVAVLHRIISNREYGA